MKIVKFLKTCFMYPSTTINDDNTEQVKGTLLKNRRLVPETISKNQPKSKNPKFA